MKKEFKKELYDRVRSLVKEDHLDTDELTNRNFNPTVNVYDRFSMPNVVSTYSIDNWFKKIKFSEHANVIMQVRDGKKDKNVIKQTLPCITYNFLYDKYKEDKNIISPTGLMYIDIDNEKFDINELDLNKVYACYKSLGGKGYAIIIRVDDLSLSNFKSTYLHITDQLGLNEFIDRNAIKASQFNVLSYDEDIFINKDSFVFSSLDVAPPSIVIKKKNKTTAYTTERVAELEFKQIRYDDLNEIKIEADYIVNWDGYDIIKCFIPIKKITKNRNNVLLSYLNNFVYLNPHISEERALKTLKNINEIACLLPVEDNQLNRIVKSIFTYKKNGKLKPIYFKKKRKIVFDKKCKLTKEEKFGICRIENANKKTNDSKQKLYSIIETWNFIENDVITQRKIISNHPISKKTVEKYWKEFKDFVTQLNDIFQNENKSI